MDSKRCFRAATQKPPIGKRSVESLGMRSFDLNLARIFILLYETGSVTATADTPHLTQPTVSYSLAKLRRHFGDDFRRTGAD
ncbi:LysR family transcriptional regulator [Streptomyces sp. NPDC014006]|uniref:LysR family transcriptional regulator n=1 Tax=Streptomyces sp. NPDC014006 TaxID=3364870 RepID=UPI0036F88268